MALNLKQEHFVREYLVDYNATRAAIAAGYSKDTAREMGYENLTKPHIQEAIKKITEERFNRLDISADRIMEEYAKLGFSDIGGYLQYKTALTRVGIVDDEEVIEYRQVIEVKDSTEVDTSAISEVSISKDGTFKFKLHDKKGALDSMARTKGMFQDKVEHTGTISIEKLLEAIE